MNMQLPFRFTAAWAASILWFAVSAAEVPPAAKDAAAKDAAAKDAAAKDAKSPTDATPAKVGAVGIRTDGITSPEMREAIDRMQKAGVVEGRRGSLTFFRWTDSTPPKLAHLGLWGSNVDNELLALVSTMPDLEHVALYETSVTDQGLAALAGLTKLRSFSVSPVLRYEKPGFGPPQWSYPFLPQRPDRPRITGNVVQALASIKTLERLDLLDARLTSADLVGLSAFPKLSSLSLPAAIDDQTVKHLQACHRLNTLTLGEREITATELQTLSAWKSLRKLTIVHAQLSDEALGALAKLESVEELHLMDCGLTDNRLKHLQGSPKLAYLALEWNEIDGPGLEHLVKLNLKSLGLEHNNINDATLPHLSQLISLERLSLSYCRGITDQGIRSGTLQKMSHLKELGVRGATRVTDESLDDLVKFGHLGHLNIRQTKISPTGVERMKTAMPKTTVFK